VTPGAEAFERGTFRKYFGLLPPTEVLARGARHFATLNASPDDDGVNRRIALVSTVSGSGVVLPTLALEAVRVAEGGAPVEVLGAAGDLSPQGIRVGGRVAPVDLSGSVLLDWYGRFHPDEMPIVSLADILDGAPVADAVRDRVVLVAATAIGTHDQRVTPLERAVPGVYVHATLAQNLLDGRHLVRPPYAVALELALFLAIGLVAGLVMARASVPVQVALAAALALGWLAVDQFVFFRRGIVVSTVLPVVQVALSLLGVAVQGYLVEQRERRKTRQAFGRYLAPRVMEQVLSNPEEHLRLGGRRHDATVLFSDIRCSTST
jgi:adenylate cyclase